MARIFHLPQLQFLPLALATIWCVFYLWRRALDWKTDFPLLALVSLLAAPYSWYFDQVALVPALLYGYDRVRLLRSGRLLLLALYAVLNLLPLLLILLHYTTFAYSWTASAWLLLYLLVLLAGRKTLTTEKLAVPVTRTV